MSYFGSRYLAIRSAALRDTFVLEHGAAECSSYMYKPSVLGHIPVQTKAALKQIKIPVLYNHIFRNQVKLNWLFTSVPVYGDIWLYLCIIWDINCHKCTNLYQPQHMLSSGVYLPGEWTADILSELVQINCCFWENFLDVKYRRNLSLLSLSLESKSLLYSDCFISGVWSTFTVSTKEFVILTSTNRLKWCRWLR